MKIDWLTVTVPQDGHDAAWLNFHNVVFSCGAEQVAGRDHQYRVGESGLFSAYARNDVIVFTASGGAITELLRRNLYADYLWAFAEGPHRVTRMDIALDIPVDSPALLDALWARACSKEGISLTRKRLRENQLTFLKSPRPDGLETGTIYLGKKTAEVHARVYDKRHERWVKTGKDIGALLTRYELTLTNKAGITLSDAYTPEPAFWHFMGNMMKKPTDTTPWQPGEQGFSLPDRELVLPAEKMRRRVERSVDLETLAALASEVGPGGSQMLLRLISEKLSSSSVVTPDQPTRSLRAI